MPIKRDQPLPRPSQVIEKMTIGKRYTADALAIKFRVMCAEMHKLLDTMVDHNMIQRYRGATDSKFFIEEEKAKEPELPGRYQAEFKPLGIYNLKQHMEACEASRSLKNNGLI